MGPTHGSDPYHGMNLQRLGSLGNTAGQDRVKLLEEKLFKTERKKEEAKRSMERSNAVLNNRIKRLEEQLTNIGGGTSREVSIQICGQIVK